MAANSALSGSYEEPPSSLLGSGAAFAGTDGGASSDVAASAEISALGIGHRLFSAWPRDGRPSVGADRIAAAIATSRKLIQADRATLTLDKYARDFALFGYWVIENRPTNEIVPTHPALLGIYIGDLLNQGLSKNRVLSRIAAVQFANDALGHKLRIDEGSIHRQIRGLRRLPEVDRQERTALRQEEATLILEELGPPKTLLDYREHALMALGWTSALRRANLARLRVCDVKIKYDPVNVNRYIEVYVATSKTDQEGKGRYVHIPEMPENHPLCAVRAVEAWVTRSGLASQPNSPLFRSFTPRGFKIKESGIGGRDVTLALKRMARATGRDETKLAAHAMRRGFATSSDEKGIRRSVIREHGGWKSDAMIDRYTRLNAVRDNAIAELFGRKNADITKAARKK
jgi:site-specific recombinase XerD